MPKVSCRFTFNDLSKIDSFRRIDSYDIYIFFKVNFPREFVQTKEVKLCRRRKMRSHPLWPDVCMCARTYLSIPPKKEIILLLAQIFMVLLPLVLETSPRLNYIYYSVPLPSFVPCPGKKVEE